jgi:Flp pilus assembly protein TadD
VADHFQYLASLGLIALAAGGAAWLSRRWGLGPRRAGYAGCLLLLSACGVLSWRQCRVYTNVETLYRVTLASNPECRMAHKNLGAILHSQGKLDEALIHCRRAIEIDPNEEGVYVNVGGVLADLGRRDDAIASFRQALRLKPRDPLAYNGLGVALARWGRVDEAMANYQKALELDPNFGDAYSNRGTALIARGQFDEAFRDFQKAVQLKPNSADAQSNLGLTLARCGRFEEAIARCRLAMEIQPTHAMARANLNLALEMQEAEVLIARLRQAVDTRPDDIRLHNELGMALARGCRWTEALAHYRRALEIKPDYVEATCNLAWLRASAAEPSLRSGAEAIKLARRAVELIGGKNPIVFGALAAAYAEAGQFVEAVATGRQAVSLALQQNNQAAANVLRAQLSLYEAGKPFRHTVSASSPGPKP